MKEETTYCKEHPHIPLISVKYEDGTIKKRCGVCDINKLT